MTGRWAGTAAAALLIVASALPAAARELSVEGHLTQGGLVIARGDAGIAVTVDGRAVRVSPEGLFLVGFGRDAPPTVEVRVRYPDGVTTVRVLHVARRTYQVQRIDGLPPQKVTPDPKDLERIRLDGAAIAAVRARDSSRADFASRFQWPVRGRVSGVFGSQRILNGKPRNPHGGVDVVAPRGTPVVASAGGVVVLAHPDMFFTGRTVMIDHGHGLATVYAHMSEILVTQGQPVARGTPIGRVGASGRATGPHLHWGVSLFGTRLDPALLAGPMPK